MNLFRKLFPDQLTDEMVAVKISTNNKQKRDSHSGLLLCLAFDRIYGRGNHHIHMGDLCLKKYVELDSLVLFSDWLDLQTVDTINAEKRLHNLEISKSLELERGIK